MVSGVHPCIQSYHLYCIQAMMKLPSVNVCVSLKLAYFSTFCTVLASSLNPDGVSLLAIKAAIAKDPTEALISWSDSDSTPCNWSGIACDRTSHRVTSVSLSGRNLTGYVPSEIGALSFLTTLDLSENFFSGPFPKEVSSLLNLTHLDVSSNYFNGSLPSGLGNLTRMVGTLNLSYNEFSGEIPESFGRFPVMVSLDLRHNNLTGKIPQLGSLLNQGPTAFSGNPSLCGFPLNVPCTLLSEPQNPNLAGNPQKPENGVLSSNSSAKSRNAKLGPAIVAAISGVFFVFVAVFVLLWTIKRRRKTEKCDLGKQNRIKEAGMGSEEGQKGKFSVIDEGFGLELEDLLRASAYVVGKSKSGIVYRVVVGGGGKAAGSGVSGPAVVAVRRLSEGDSSWRFKEFEAEVEAIGRVEHPNIVRLRAYYYASDEKLLVSDFIGNGSLYSALHGEPGNSMDPLSWAARLKIIRETARGLMHIHEYSPKKYVHGSIKSSKILLDDDLKPYISGFGLTRLVQCASKPSTEATYRKNATTPTLAYVAPEAKVSGAKLTQKCDVYSFGILLLEILTGRVPDGRSGSEYDAVDAHVRKVFHEERPMSEIIDPGLLHEVCCKKQVVAAFHVALNCTEVDPEMRPRMRNVVDSLDSIN